MRTITINFFETVNTSGERQGLCYESCLIGTVDLILQSLVGKLRSFHILRYLQLGSLRRNYYDSDHTFFENI